jgi:ribosome maturation factor RimP
MDLAGLIEQAVRGLGYEFVDLESTPRGRLLRVFIDNPAQPGAVRVDDCARVSNHLTRLFEVENVDYDRLEVSSPGLDRVLKSMRDFERFAGQEAQVKLRLPVDGRRNFTGVLGAVVDGKLTLQCGDKAVTLELAQIEKARLVPKY